LISFYTVYRLKSVKPSPGEEDPSAEDTIEPPAKKRPRVVTETIL
jgi:hypothetical protein